MRILKNLIIGLVLLIIGIVILMLIPSPQGTTDKPWEITTMSDGNSQVMNIHLGNTDYKTAQQKLGVFGETALFVDPDGSRSVEAFFNSINQGGLSAKLVMNLGVSDKRLELMQQRATAGKRQPSGARQLELAQIDREFLLSAPVTGLTYIPSVRLKPAMIESRFGNPVDIEQLSDDNGEITEIWQYPAIGLEVLFQGDNKPVLIYHAKR